MWHEEYNKYRAGVKDLEVMLQNVINAGFESITTVQEGVELLDVFTEFTTREVRKRHHTYFTVSYSILTLYIQTILCCSFRP